jgi:hypothetical protein
MKHLITEKPNTLVIFLEAEKLSKMCAVADFIEDTYPQSVIEVTHNREAEQGTIILKKGQPSFKKNVHLLISQYE